MYKVFDSFLETDTWHKGHSNDNERFYKALSQIIDNPNFSPESMGEHMFTKLGLSSSDENDLFVQKIRELVTAAWHISDYLKAT